MDVAHDHDAVLPVRLRRAVRRRDRGDRVAASIGRRTCASRRCGSRRSARAIARPSVVGPVRRPLDDAEPRRGRAAVGAHRPQAGRRADGAALRRLLVAHDVVARGARLLRVGESGPFIDGGERIARDGVLPLNTHGGQLSAGRLHGYGFLHEGATQMWGEAGDRQIADAARGRRRSPPAAATPAAASSSSASSPPTQPAGTSPPPHRDTIRHQSRRSALVDAPFGHQSCRDLASLAFARSPSLPPMCHRLGGSERADDDRTWRGSSAVAGQQLGLVTRADASRSRTSAADSCGGSCERASSSV